MKKNKNKIAKVFGKKMTRKEAIKKTGITALTAASLMFIQTKASAQTSGNSPGAPPAW
mgnify:CR=1 FL=1